MHQNAGGWKGAHTKCSNPSLNSWWHWQKAGVACVLYAWRQTPTDMSSIAFRTASDWITLGTFVVHIHLTCNTFSSILIDTYVWHRQWWQIWHKNDWIPQQRSKESFVAEPFYLYFVLILRTTEAPCGNWRCHLMYFSSLPLIQDWPNYSRCISPAWIFLCETTKKSLAVFLFPKCNFLLFVN